MTWLFITVLGAEMVVNIDHVVRVAIVKDKGNKHEETLYTVTYTLSTGETLTAKANKEQKLRVINLFHHENGMMDARPDDEKS